MGAPPLAMWPPLSRPRLKPLEVAQALNHGPAQGGVFKVGFLHPLANCRIIQLACHQSESVECSFLPRKTTQNKASLLKMP